MPSIFAEGRHFDMCISHYLSILYLIMNRNSRS